MNKLAALIKISAALLALVLIASGCATAVIAPTSVATPQPAVSAAPTDAPATPAPTATVAPTPTPAPALVSQDTSSVAAFKLFNLVKLGMTKAEVDKALGQVGVSNNDEDAKNNTFDYQDDQACGVKVAYNSDNKAYFRMVIYNDPVSTFSTVIAKPVTEDQSKEITEGMAYTDVVTLLGGVGIVSIETADQSDCTSNIARTLDWGNADGSYIEVELAPDNTVLEADFIPYEAE